ncbi:MAG TPA: DUF3187 family protein [Gemmatimonadales bacterium]|nr:DUF3187 family protein [Gemmatimonadales bacterium]
MHPFTSGRPEAVIVACCLATAAPARAQGLPPWGPINPAAGSRSGLYFQPTVDSAPGRWRAAVSVDYGSAIEYNLPAVRPSYLLDVELLRVNLAVQRQLGPRTFALAELPLLGAYGGFLDGFLKWYHDLLGVPMPERDLRPNNAFAYELTPPNGVQVTREQSDLFIGDLRLGAAYRLTPDLQTVLSVTFPTSTGPAGYGRGTLSLSSINTVRVPFASRFVYEGSLGLGVTPSHGETAEFQREVFLAATSGLRFRFWGRQSVFVNFLYHSPYYDGVALPALDQRELSLDFGWILAASHGREWRLGMVEDLEPSGPGIDLVFRVGVSF